MRKLVVEEDRVEKEEQVTETPQLMDVREFQVEFALARRGLI